MATPNHNNGLVIFIRKLPAQVIESVLRSRLQPYLLNVGIDANGFALHKPKARGIATMHVFSRAKGEAFLASMKQFPSTLSLSRFIVDFERHENQDGGAMLRDRKFIDQVVADAYVKTPLEGKMNCTLSVILNLVQLLMTTALTLDGHSQRSVQTTASRKTFNLDAISCGNWRYGSTGSPMFVSEYSSNRPGKLLIGSRSIVAILSQRYSPNEWVQRIDFEWEFVDIIYTQGGRLPSLMITCKYGPRMYRRVEAEQMASPLRRTIKSQRKKARIPCLDTAHSKIVGSCFTYELIFDAQESLPAIRSLVEHIPDGPTSMRISVQTVIAKTPFDGALQELNLWLSQTQLPFPVRFQAMKLVLNGHLPPKSVTSLVHILVDALTKGRSALHCAEALRQFDRDLPWPGPQTPYKEMAPKAMEDLLKQLIDGGQAENSTSRAVRRNDTLALIHHAVITPTGLYLEGPEPEVSSRDKFLRNL
jgi:hypothetical protein